MELDLSPAGIKKCLPLHGDSSISWKKNENLLHFDGIEANFIKKEMCKQICEDGEDNLVSARRLTRSGCWFFMHIERLF
jgi:hypothetical protein